jgi:hypothetical protein
MARQYLNLAQVYGAIDQSRANQMDMENARMQQEQFRNQVARQQREEERVQGLRDLYKGAIEIDETGAPRLNEKALPKKLYEMGYGEEAIKLQGDLQKREIDAQKAQSQAQKDALAAKVETAKYLRDRLATVQDQAGFDAVLAEAAEIGAPALVQSLGKQYNPEVVGKQIYTADDWIKKTENELNRGVTMRGQDITMRGQDMTDSRTRSEGAANRAVQYSGQNLTKQRLDFDRSGGTAAVNAKNGVTAKPEKLTEGMRNNAMYAQRMTAAENLLEGTQEQKPGMLETIAGGAPLVGSELGANQFRSADRQRAVQAQRDWVRAKLRKESGAAIGVDEMNQEISTYFPQIGDSPEVIQQKKIAREQATQGLIQSSGGAYSPPTEPAKPIMAKNEAMPKSNKLPVPIKSDADYNKLPKGTRFKAPDGSIRIKQ